MHPAPCPDCTSGRKCAPAQPFALACVANQIFTFFDIFFASPFVSWLYNAMTRSAVHRTARSCSLQDVGVGYLYLFVLCILLPLGKLLVCNSEVYNSRFSIDSLELFVAYNSLVVMVARYSMKACAADSVVITPPPPPLSSIYVHPLHVR